MERGGKSRLLSEVQLRRLKEHRYSAESSSLFDPLLQKWWNWLVTQVPLWLAPNLITSLGLLVNILTSLILIYYSPDCKQTVSVLLWSSNVVAEIEWVFTNTSTNCFGLCMNRYRPGLVTYAPLVFSYIKAWMLLMESRLEELTRPRHLGNCLTMGVTRYPQVGHGHDPNNMYYWVNSRGRLRDRKKRYCC